MKKLFKYFVFALAVSLTACSTEDPTDNGSNNSGDGTENPDGGNNGNGGETEKITADFDFSVDKSKGSVTFTNKSIGADAYEWTFGDDQDGFSTEKDPVYTYSKPGTYKVTLVSSKGTDYAEISKDVTVEINKKEVAIKIDDDSFDDWKDIPARTDIEMTGFTTIKTVATNNFIYIYMVGPKDVIEEAGYGNFAVDLDYNYETGQRDGHFPGGKSGCDVAREIDGSFVWGWRQEESVIGWDWQANKELVTYGTSKTIDNNCYKEWRMDLNMAKNFIDTNEAHGMQELDQSFAKEINQEKVRVYVWLRNTSWEFKAAAPKLDSAPFDIKIGEYVNTAE